MITGQASFLQSLGWAVLNSLWQLALLWVFYQVITGIFSIGARGKTTKSSFKASLASLLLITGFIWFVYTFIAIYVKYDSGQSILSASFLISERSQLQARWLQQTLPIASVLYLVLLILPAAHFIRNYRYVRVIRKYGLAKVDIQWRMFIKKAAAQMGIKKTIQIWVSEFVSSPVTIGFLKPVILVPLAAINHLSAQQMEAVLLHELSHIRRYDYFINFIVNIIQTVLYFNPFVKTFVKIIEREREKSCDEMVLQFQYDSYEYATALLTLEKTNLEYKSLVVAAAGKKNDLLQRVELIMGMQKKALFSFNKIAGLLAGLFCFIALNALLIISKPLNADKARPFASLSSPFNFLTGSFNESTKPLLVKEQPSGVPSHIIKQAKESEVNAVNPLIAPALSAPVVINVNLAYQQADYGAVEVPQLKKHEEEQVKAAMDASKKVLENAEWKALENNIAEVLTRKEKEELKTTYQKELEKFDWTKWENKLRLAYDKVNWNRVNEQLTKAVSNIRIDSLQRVYDVAICKLDIAKQELSLNNLKGIPDTDITLKALEETKQKVQKTLNSLKTLRNKKIVSL